MPKVTRPAYRAAAFVAAALLAGCSSPSDVSGPVLAVHALSNNATGLSGTSPAKLFVANCYDATVYQMPSGTYQKKIGFAYKDERILLVTSSGYAIVGITDGSNVRIYGGSKLKFLQKLKVPYPFAMAQDATGDLYILSGGRSVYEYAPGSTLPYDPTPVRTITSGFKDAQRIAVDTIGNLYVANTGVRFKGTTVPVFGPGSTTPTRTITEGISGPYSLALDKSNNLYVGNFLPAPGNNVTVYQAGTSKLMTTIKSGISEPNSLAFDGSGSLYVANGGESSHGTVTVYSSKNYALTRTISNGLEEPESLALDKSNNLYVANSRGNSVTVYSQSSDEPTQTITQNVCYPSAVDIQQ